MTSVSKLWSSFRTDIAVDRRKTVALVVLFVVMLGVLSRLAFQGSSSTGAPLAAEQAPSDLIPRAPQAAPQPGRAPGVTAGGQSPESALLLVQGEPVSVEISGASRDLVRDPFTVHSAYAAQLLAAMPSGGDRRKAEPGLLQQLAAALRAQRDRRRAAEQAVHKQSESLRLQSTLIGRDPIAVINGQPFRLGATVEGFELIEVRSREVVVRKEGINVTLSMR